MVRRRRARCRLGASLALAWLLIVCPRLPLLADVGLGVPGVSAGSLTETALSGPSLSVTLNGSDQAPSTTFSVEVNDATGSGAGWRVQITSTQFTTGGTSPHTLAPSAAAITAVSAVCKQGTCTAPANSIAYPVLVPAGATPPGAVSFFNAAVNTGLGDFTLTPTLRVSVPANSYAGSYTTTLTLSIASGP